MIEINNLEQRLMESSNIEVVFQSEDEISAKHDKIHFRVNMIVYLLLFLVAVYYGIYGYMKYTKSNEYPLIKSYKETTPTYPIPTTVSCVTINDKGYYFDLTDDNLKQYIVSVNEIKSLTINEYQIIHNTIPDQNAECIMIIPPYNATINTENTHNSYWGINYSYYYWSYGYLKPDEYLSQNFNYSIPSFLANEEKFIVAHTAFHIDYFMEVTDPVLNGNYSDILLYGYIWGLHLHDFVASPFSKNNLILNLEQTEKMNGDITRGFSIASGAKFTSVLDNHVTNCTNITNDICSFVEIIYKPAIKDLGFSLQRNIEYSDYSIPDLISGMGGILSSAYGVFGPISTIILFGISILCIEWGGFAPFPNFDDNFKERLHRLIDTMQLSSS